MDCNELFKNRKGASTICKEVDAAYSKCACETNIISEFSPGLISDDEILVRVIFNEDHILENGLHPAEFSTVKTFGLSVLRKLYCDKTEFERLIQKVFDGKEVKGIAIVKTKDIKNIVDKGERIFCLYDTSEQGNVSHSDIFQVNGGKSFQKEMRKRLREKFGKALNLNDMYPK